jgi:EAL domain-containing protein (putative c-di-GMP-specific phosphodiesterase class I)
VIAEGVETAEELDALRRMECAAGQGYYWARPLDPGAAFALLQSSQVLAAAG